MDRARFADYLRTRRGARQPEEVGLPRGARRRRTRGLRREEVARLSDISVDYYTRLEQPRGPQPSVSVLGALSRTLGLTLDERDHLYRLAGHPAPPRSRDADVVQAGMMRIFDALPDAAVQVVTQLGETLMQTDLSAALVGDESVYTGRSRSLHYRWFTDLASRRLYVPEDRAAQSRLIVADLLASYTRDGAESRVGAVVRSLLEESPEFADLWQEHPVAGPYCGPVRLSHPRVGRLELHCQRLIDPDQSQQLVVYTAAPGTESHEKMRLLSVVGGQDVYAAV
ncbi:helix-turn-helix transcriptional regulator [Cryptosporangium japonicum]|uniref:Helix-turn-helix transcriptional regulator n=1 Tax=Cryptosporangium japonicum TaxID=80872 RepID=A0ABN0V4V3_9ACTN